MDRVLTQTISNMALQSLLFEVSLSPKPGLVDRLNNGAHTDMDFNTFIKSSVSLSPFFSDYVLAGYQHKDSLTDLFNQVRQIGIRAEQAMFKATDGINTHKGANFSFALILAALGYYWQTNPITLPLQANETSAILRLTGEMCRVHVLKDFSAIPNKESLTYGERLFRDYGLKGIRGEAASGYETLDTLLLPFLRTSLSNQRYDPAESFLRAMILLMSKIEDGNLIHRGGIAAWESVKTDCQQLRKKELNTREFYQWLEDYDCLLIERHLSPGGTADMLALGYFFMQLEDYI